MEKLKEIHLCDLSYNLVHTHVNLNLEFLSKLLISSSKSDKPWRNNEYAIKISCPVNKNKKSSTTVYGWIKGYRTVPFSKLINIVELSDYTWRDIELNLISIKAGIRKGEAFPIFPIMVNEKVGSIVGHILGDGSIDKRFHSLFFSNSNTELLNEFRDNMKVVFGIEPRIWIQKKTNYGNKTEWLRRNLTLKNIPKGNNVGLFYPKICSDILYAIAGKFAEGKLKMITPEIINFNTRCKKGLIRAFFDDDDSVRSDNYTIRFFQDDKVLLKQIRNLIEEFGINSHDLKYYIKQGKAHYYFNINGFKNYVNFYRNIGCTSSKKIREFEELINKVQHSKYFKKKYAV